MDLKGWKLDTLPQDSPVGSWAWAKNILLSKKFNAPVNEDGFNLEFEDERYIIGVIPTDRCHVVFSTDNKNNHEIGIYENGVYTAKSTDIFWNFSLDHPIEGVWIYNNAQEIIVSFTDFYNEIRVLNVDNVPSVLNTNAVSLFPDITSPDWITIEEIQFGGVLKTGSYYFTYRYGNNLGLKTQWQEKTAPLLIAKSIDADFFDNYDGGEPDEPTSKAIKATVTNLDSNFSTIDIAVIRKNGGVTTAALIVQDLNIPSSLFINFIYNGNELEELPLNEVLIPTTSYPLCKTLTLNDDKLVLGNVKSQGVPNLQKFVNNIKVTFSVQEYDMTLNTNSSKYSFQGISLMPREVYALYFVAKLKKGGFAAFHIPGRRATGVGETGASAYAAAAGLDAATEVYKIEDTANFSTGALGFWQNNNEYYPNAGSDIHGDYEVWDATGQIDTIQGENVRHHRMPSVRACKTQEFTTAGGHLTYGYDKREKITLILDDVYIPDEYKAQIDYWTLGTAVRTLDNSLVVGEDIISFGGKTSTTPTLIRSLASNHTDYGAGSGSPVLINDYHTQHWFGRNFELLIAKPSVRPSYLAVELRLKIETYTGGVPDATPTPQATDYLIKRNSGVDVINSVEATLVPTIGASLQAISDFKYIPADVQDDQIVNYNNGEMIYIKLINSPTDILEDYTRIWHDLANGGAVWEMPLVTYLNLFSDVYLDYTQQTINLYAAHYGVNDTTGSFLGGDIFITEVSTTQQQQLVINPVGYAAELVHTRVLLATPFNAGLRYIDDTDDGTRYYPKSYPYWLKGGGGTEPIGQRYAYNNDYTAINILDSSNIYIYDYRKTVPFEHPFRIVKGTKIVQTNTVLSLGSFLANDFYEMPRNKGVIWQLTSFNNSLIIHQKNATHIAFIKDIIGTDEASAYIGAGDIFDRPPTELIPDTLGYAGCKSQWAVANGKVGHFFVDEEQGKVFLINGQNIKEISNNGISTYLRKVIPLTDTVTDNPFNRSGLTAGYDEKFNRFILTKREYTIREDIIIAGDFEYEGGVPPVYEVGEVITYKGNYYIVKAGAPVYATDIAPVVTPEGDGHAELLSYDDTDYFNNNSMTFSYSCDYNFWVCKHDYFPSYYYNTRKGLFAVYNNGVLGSVYKTNDETKVGKYFKGEVFKSYIDMVFPYVDAVNLESIQWNTDVFELDGTKKYNDKTFTEIFVYNTSDCTKVVTLVNTASSSLLGKGNVRNTLRVWSFDDLNSYILNPENEVVSEHGEIVTANIDNNKKWYKVTVIMGDYVIARLIYSNVEQLRIFLNYINPTINKPFTDTNTLIK